MSEVMSSPTLRQLLRTCDIGAQLNKIGESSDPQMANPEQPPPPRMDVPDAIIAESMWMTHGDVDDDSSDNDDINDSDSRAAGPILVANELIRDTHNSNG